MRCRKNRQGKWNFHAAKPQDARLAPSGQHPTDERPALPRLAMLGPFCLMLSSLRFGSKFLQEDMSLHSGSQIPLFSLKISYLSVLTNNEVQSLFPCKLAKQGNREFDLVNHATTGVSGRPFSARTQKSGFSAKTPCKSPGSGNPENLVRCGITPPPLFER